MKIIKKRIKREIKHSIQKRADRVFMAYSLIVSNTLKIKQTKTIRNLEESVSGEPEKESLHRDMIHKSCPSCRMF